MEGTYVGDPNPRTMLVEGPFGAGKTTFAIETLFAWLDAGIAPERILILVPQRTLARRYIAALSDASLGPLGDIQIRTLGGLAKEASELFFKLASKEAGFATPQKEPQFLTIETSQYTMSRFVEDAVQRGEFEAVSVSPQQIARQIVDNLGKAAIMGIDYHDVPTRLIAAWGDKAVRQVYAYQAAGRVAEQFRNHCLENTLLDYSLQVEVFRRLLRKPLFREQFLGRYSHLIAEHIEEEATFSHDLIKYWLQHLDGGLLTYEWDGGYRVFLGADVYGVEELREACDGTMTMADSHITSEDVAALKQEVRRSFFTNTPAPDEGDAGAAFQYTFNSYFPQMLDWVAERIEYCVNEEGIAPREIAVLAPFLSDSLRFSLTQKLEQRGIASVSHRPSRALKDEPAARCLLTFAALAHPQWFGESMHELKMPQPEDVANALQIAIEDLDPVRARLLTKIVYKPKQDFPLTTFAQINPKMQARITFVAGQKYDALRNWLAEYAALPVGPVDHFFSRLFGEMLSQPGYGFHGDNYEFGRNDAGRVVSELVESAQKFRRDLYEETRDYHSLGIQYFTIVQQGLLGALYLSSWRDELSDAVFMAPAYTFLMRNRAVDVQFWLDVGAQGWWERLEQPLTHPYVLSSNWEADRVWMEADEYATQQDVLYRIMRGLLARCRKRVYLGISDLGEQGYEQRGPMLRVLQQILSRTRKDEGS